MLSKLVRQLGMLLLAVSLVTSPVLGAMPRCCQTGAIKGSGNCCCGPREEADELPSCCQHAQRACCAESAANEAAAEAESNQADFPTAGAAPCNCKTTSQMPALVPSKDKVETQENELYVVAVASVAHATTQNSLSHIGDHHQAEPPGLPLHKVHCRWTI
jgi:hypothetical protein